MPRQPVLTICLAALVALPAAARAQDAPPNLLDRTTLIDSTTGPRARLVESGITLGVQEQSEIWGNLRGGARRGGAYFGMTTATIAIDTERLVGLPGGSAYISVFQLHGTPITSRLTGSAQEISGIDGAPTTRLGSIWYEQRFADDFLSVRLGQMSLDEEFMSSNAAAILMNVSFSTNHVVSLRGADTTYSGGPLTPVAAPGIRIKLMPTEQIAVLGAVLTGEPFDHRRNDRNGLLFRMPGGTISLLEMQYALNQGESDNGLPGTYKLGGWFSTARVDDEYYDNRGLSLANPASSGVPRLHTRNWRVYAIADQMVWRRQETKDEGLTVFAGASVGPSDRNPADLSLFAGVNWKGIVPDRADDVAGFGISYLRASRSVRRLDADYRTLGASASPIHDREMVFEMTYKIQATGWMQLQPSIQYIHHPSAYIANPSRPTEILKDALAIGTRLTVTF